MIKTNSLRLLSLPTQLIDMIRNEKISRGHAKILIGLDNAILIAEKVIKKNCPYDRPKIWLDF